MLQLSGPLTVRRFGGANFAVAPEILKKEAGEKAVRMSYLVNMEEGMEDQMEEFLEKYIENVDSDLDSMSSPMYSYSSAKVKVT